MSGPCLILKCGARFSAFRCFIEDNELRRKTQRNQSAKGLSGSPSPRHGQTHRDRGSARRHRQRDAPSAILRVMSK
jgi:hypothetical protein